MLNRTIVEDYLTRQDATGMHAIGRALVHLFNRQTNTEQRFRQTQEDNEVGFTQGDAKRGSLDAQFYIRTGYLTAGQMTYWQARANPNNPRSKPRICKYSLQILNIALSLR